MFVRLAYLEDVLLCTEAIMLLYHGLGTEINIVSTVCNAENKEFPIQAFMVLQLTVSITHYYAKSNFIFIFTPYTAMQEEELVKLFRAYWVQSDGWRCVRVV